MFYWRQLTSSLTLQGASFGVGRPHYQMRSQMLQNLMDMGFKVRTDACFKVLKIIVNNNTLKKTGKIFSGYLHFVMETALATLVALTSGFLVS